MLVDVAWMLSAVLVGWYVFGRRLSEKSRQTSSLVCAIVSLFFGYKLIFRAACQSGSHITEAMLYGVAGGALVLCAAWGFRLLLEPKKEA